MLLESPEANLNAFNSMNMTKIKNILENKKRGLKPSARHKTLLVHCSKSFCIAIMAHNQYTYLDTLR